MFQQDLLIATKQVLDSQISGMVYNIGETLTLQHTQEKLEWHQSFLKLLSNVCFFFHYARLPTLR